VVAGETIFLSINLSVIIVYYVIIKYTVTVNCTF